jgi:hypothetical protein
MSSPTIQIGIAIHQPKALTIQFVKNHQPVIAIA